MSAVVVSELILLHAVALLALGAWFHAIRHRIGNVVEWQIDGLGFVFLVTARALDLLSPLSDNLILDVARVGSLWCAFAIFADQLWRVLDSMIDVPATHRPRFHLVVGGIALSALIVTGFSGFELVLRAVLVPAVAILAARVIHLRAARNCQGTNALRILMTLLGPGAFLAHAFGTPQPMVFAPAWLASTWTPTMAEVALLVQLGTALLMLPTVGVYTQRLAAAVAPSPFGGNRWRALALSATLLSVVLLAGLVVDQRVAGYAREELFKQGAVVIENVVRDLDTQVQAAEQAARLLAGTARVIALFSEPSPAALAATHQALDHFNGVLHTSVCYLMTATGTVVATSNRFERNSFMGQNYAFRPYFKEALHGNTGIYLARGVTSQEVGLYAARPVVTSSNTVGIITVKAPLGRLGLPDDFGDRVALVSPDGIILTTNHAPWSFCSVWPLTAEHYDRVRHSRQFGDLSSRAVLLPVMPADRATVDIENRSWFVQRRATRIAGWQIMMWQRARIVADYQVFILLLTLLLAAMVVINLVGLSRSIDITDRIARSEQRFKTMMRGAPDAMLIFDAASHKITDVNAACERLLGYPHTQLLQMSYLELSAAMRTEVEENTRATLAAGELFVPLHRFKRADGSTVSAELKATVLSLENHDSLLVFARDISEREKRETMLHRLSLAVEQSASMVLVTDTRGNIAYCNPAFSRITGYSISELMGRNTSLLKSGMTAPGVYLDLWMHLAAGQEWRGEFINRRKNGEFFWVTAAISPVRDTAGVVENFMAIMTDITERRRTEQALKEARDFLETVLDTALALIVGLDRNGRVMFGNRCFAELVGREREEVIGSHFIQTFIAGEAAPRIEKQMTTALAGQAGAIRFECPLIDAKNQRRLVEWNTGVIRDDRGQVQMVLATGIDITERKNAEGALQQAKEVSDRSNLQLLELNRRLEEATRQATELAASAERANSAKSDFLATMSHEIRTPMNSIIGLTELMFDLSPNAEQREYLTMIRSSASTLLTLINDILDFAKIEARKITLENIAFDMRDVIEETVLSLAIRAHDKGLELLCQIAPDIPTQVIGDPLRFRQVIFNLVGNAIKFTERGEVTIELMRDQTPGTPGGMHLVVRDTGIGIPEERIQRIFTPYSQADASTSRQFGGTGLGLTISLRLLELMGGRIWVDSRVGEGSTFHVVVPLVPICDKPTAISATESLNGITALVIDDHRTTRMWLNDTLRHWGMQAMQTDSLAGAVQAIKSAVTPFRIVILDQDLPLPTGETGSSSQLIHEAFSPRDAGHIITLGTLGRVGGDRSSRAIRHTHLLKPVRQRELLRALLSAVSGREVPLPVSEHPTPPVSSAISPATPGPAPHHGGSPVAGAPSVWPTGRQPAPPLSDLRLLVVEDNPVNQRLASRMLARMGHQVDIVDDGEKALAAIRAGNYDIVLMDVQMPIMDGLTATQTLRTEERQTGRHQLVVAMTAHAMKGDRERCLEAGMDSYLSKPVKADELNAIIQDLLHRQAEREPPPADAAATPVQPPVASERGTPPTPSAEPTAEAAPATTPAAPPVESTPPPEIGATAQSIFDEKHLLSRIDNDRDLLAELIDIFVSSTPELLDRIEQAANTGDAVKVEHTAHTVKGAVGNFAAEPARQVAFTIEKLGRAKDLSTVLEHLSNLRQLIDQTVRELRALVERMPKG